MHRQRFGGRAGGAVEAVARHHGLALRPGELAWLVDSLPDGSLLPLLHAARLVGLEAVPLEGDYDQLPEVPLPAVVILREGADSSAFHVLWAMDANAVTVTDPRDNTRTAMDRRTFVSRWTGDAVSLQPDARVLAQVHARLAAHRDPIARLRGALGLQSDAGWHQLFLPGTLAALALTVTAVRQVTSWPRGAPCALMGGCLVLSLWSAMMGADCKPCARSARAVGALPVAWAGVGLYLALLVTCMAAHRPQGVVGIGLALAVGVHGGLLGVLRKAGLRCAPCVTTAVLSLGAAVTWVLAGGVPPWSVLVTVAAAVSVAPLARRAATAHVQRAVAGARTLAERVAAEAVTVAPDTVRVVVYSRPGCQQCSLFESVIHPSLVDAYGDALEVDVRNPGVQPTVTPLIVVRGTTLCLALCGLPDEDAHQRVCEAVDAAMHPDARTLARVGDLWTLRGA